MNGAMDNNAANMFIHVEIMTLITPMITST